MGKKSRSKTHSGDMPLHKQPASSGHVPNKENSTVNDNLSTITNASASTVRPMSDSSIPSGMKQQDSSAGSPLSDTSIGSSHHWEEVKDFEPVESPFHHDLSDLNDVQQEQQQPGPSTTKSVASEGLQALGKSMMTPHSTPRRIPGHHSQKKKQHDVSDEVEKQGYYSKKQLVEEIQSDGEGITISLEVIAEMPSSSEPSKDETNDIVDLVHLKKKSRPRKRTVSLLNEIKNDVQFKKDALKVVEEMVDAIKVSSNGSLRIEAKDSFMTSAIIDEILYDMKASNASGFSRLHQEQSASRYLLNEGLLRCLHSLLQ